MQSRPIVPISNVQKIELSFLYDIHQDGKIKEKITIDNEIDIKEIIHSINSGSSSKEHKCASYVKIKFINQKTEKTLYMLHSHEPGLYEIRTENGIYSFRPNQKLKTILEKP